MRKKAFFKATTGSLSVLLVSACGFIGGAKPETTTTAPTPMPSPSTTKVGALGESACEVMPLETDILRTPMVIAQGKAEVFRESTRITLKLSAPLKKESFQQGLGDAAVIDYGFKIYAPKTEKFLVYSYKTELTQLYERDCSPAVKTPQINFAYQQGDVEISFPTALLGIQADSWGVELYSAENDRVKKSTCIYGPEALQMVNAQGTFKPETD